MERQSWCVYRIRKGAVAMKIRIIRILSLILFLIVLSACSMSNPKTSIVDVTPKTAKLTLMVYMAADNDLETYALKNLKAMEKAEYEGINVLVLVDRHEGYDETDGNWNDTRFFEIAHDTGSGSNIISKRLDCAPLGLSATIQTELDTADWMVLKTFIEFSKEAYPAEKYALIMWGHGAGLGSFAIDERSDRAMSINELEKAVIGQGLCVIGFDTCFGGVIESLYELKECTTYITGCPGMTPSQGWDYKKLLEGIEKGSCSSFEIAQTMSQTSSVPAFVYTTSAINALFESFENFAGELSLSVTDNESRQVLFETLCSSKAYSAQTYPCDMFLEVRALALNYTSFVKPELKQSANNLVQAVDGAVMSPDGNVPEISIYFIPKESAYIVSSRHPSEYIKNLSQSGQCSFVKNSQRWVPTISGNSGSLLDKLFYTVF